MAGTITPPLVQHLRITGLAHRDLNRGFVGTKNLLALQFSSVTEVANAVTITGVWMFSAKKKKKYEAEISELLNLFYQMREKCSGLKQDKRGSFVK